MSACPNSTLGVAQACNTQINGENARVRRLSSKLDGGQSRPAAGKEDIESLLGPTVIEDYGLSRRSGMDPARIRAFLILLANCMRHFALDACQNWNARCDPTFFGRFLDLLDQQRAYACRPGSVKQRLHLRQNVKRKIGTHNCGPEVRTGISHHQGPFERCS